MRPSAALAIGVWVLLAAVWLLGFERVYLEVRCRVWHLRHAPAIRIGNVDIEVPAEWCPTEQTGEDLFLAKVPDDSTGVRLVYETVGTPSRRTVAWIIPTEPFLALGAKVSASDELHLDTLIKESVSRFLDND